MNWKGYRRKQTWLNSMREFSGGTEENYEEHQSGKLFSGPRFEPKTP
jgi:hypothetical protein